MIYIDNRKLTPDEDWDNTEQTDEQFGSYQEYTDWLESGYDESDYEEYP
jgi:hypothetical protein